jgi:undecaprenyl-diphosphooligosaccharide--protein glycosyltransferase
MSKENRLILGLIVLAYIFSYFFHIYFWLKWASNIPEFIWHSQVMINNPDGYFYGSGAQKIVYHEHLENPRLLDVWKYGTAVITAFLAKFFHISIDTLMLYLPPIISSLVVIPIILIGRLYNNLTWGFLAALIGSIAWSYYNRTLVGYYDTDMFSASLPMFIFYFLLASIKKRSLKYLLAAAFTIILYPFLYEQGLSIIYAMGIMAFVYLLFTKDNKISINLNDEFVFKFITLLSIALMDINWIIRIILLVIGFFLFREKKFELKQLQIIAGLFFILFLFTGNVFGIVLHKVLSYSTSIETKEGLQFLNVNRTVREAGHIPWYVIFDRIIGSSIGIVIAVIGYILLVKKYKEFIIALPLWGIGFFAFVGGLRFTVYAVPVAGISGVYFFVWFAEKIKNEKVKFLVVTLGSLFLIIPNITHIAGCCEKNKLLASFKKIYPISSYPYLTPTVFNRNEVEVLDKLKKISNPKDYVITWWDYGYPIWYYSDVNTLIDGGKHNEDNFIVSKIIMTSNELLASNLSKLAIKVYTETNKTVAPQIFTKDGKPINVDEFLSFISSGNFKAPKLDRNIYLMFPYRMFDIFPTISFFSNRNLNTGKVYSPHFFYKGRFIPQGRYLIVGRIVVDLVKGELLLNRYPIKEVDIVGYDTQNRLIVKKKVLRNQGVYLVLLQSYGEGMIMDNYYYNSRFVQMFVFENYNKNLFSPVILSPWIKIYKVK